MTTIEIDFETDDGEESLVVQLDDDLAIKLEWWLVTQGVTEA